MGRSASAVSIRLFLCRAAASGWFEGSRSWSISLAVRRGTLPMLPGLFPGRAVKESSGDAHLYSGVEDLVGRATHARKHSQRDLCQDRGASPKDGSTRLTSWVLRENRVGFRCPRRRSGVGRDACDRTALRRSPRALRRAGNGAEDLLSGPWGRRYRKHVHHYGERLRVFDEGS